MAKAKCRDCGQVMATAKGCTYNLINLGGEWYNRDLTHWGEKRCHDCGAKVGNFHHFGCDEERCPKCGEQLLGCDCQEDGVELGKGTPIPKGGD